MQTRVLDTPRRTLLLLLSFLGRRKLELGVLGIGILLRMSMAWNYHATWGYDADGHWQVVDWYVRHKSIPSPDDLFHAFHPPLFYVLAALLHSIGIARSELVWFSIGCGVVRLCLIWVAFELYLPRMRVARVSALALAAVTAASVHVDGMVYSEALSGMLLCAVMLLVPPLFNGRPRRWLLGAMVGFLLGLAMLTKVSALAVLGALLLGGLLELLSLRAWSRVTNRLLVWGALLVVFVGISGWYFARNVGPYGKVFVTSFDNHWQKGDMQRFAHVPYLERRPVEYFVGWSSSVYEWPYYPSASAEMPRFFPVAIASTFMDFWNYSFASIRPEAHTGMRVAGDRAMTPLVLQFSRYAVVGGTVMFLAVVLTWIACAFRLFQVKGWGLLSLLLVPLLVLVASLHFATNYPLDRYGVVKGVYMQFGAPPLFALFGVAVAWSTRAWWRFPFLAVLAGGFWLVTSYTVLARFGIQLFPA